MKGLNNGQSDESMSESSYSSDNHQTAFNTEQEMLETEQLK